MHDSIACMVAARLSGPRIVRPAFSLLEMIMVLCTMGFISAIAIPRMSSAADNSRDAAVKASARNIQFAMEMYAAEHFDHLPTQNADGSIQSNAVVVIARLTQKTDDSGTVMAGGMYGPYLKEWPLNPANGLRSLRIDGGATGKNTHGWQFSLTTLQVTSDDPRAPGLSGGHANAVAAAAAVAAEGP